MRPAPGSLPLYFSLDSDETMRDEDERVILVDADDVELGSAPKLEAHRTGVLHRAFSVFVFDADGRMLLQRRAEGKYHCGGLWTNAACGHPRPGEATIDAARRRLEEEMGFTCPIEPRTRLLYRADVGGGLVEHELDHVFVGEYGGEPVPDPSEVDGWRWVAAPALRAEIARAPERFTPWFRMLVEEVLGAAGAPAEE
jgi:isopentenyl-diphosphate Delta-isomerase